MSASSMNTTINIEATDPMKLLRDRAAWSALHDCPERCNSDPPRCHPGTRTAILDRIERWAEGSADRRVLWLNGPSGAGKSAVAQTLAERWSAKGTLGASFFMRRSAADVDALLPTLVCQLTTLYPATRPHVESVLTSDLSVLERPIAAQFDRLVADPLAVSGAISSDTAKIIILDGLDECSIPAEVLVAILTVSKRKIPIRFLITSRSEAAIRHGFTQGDLRELSEEVAINAGPEAHRDITLILQRGFEGICKLHGRSDSQWPIADDILQLVMNSSGQFSYPSIIVRHLSSLHINPEEALRGILQKSDAERLDHSTSKLFIAAQRAGQNKGQPSTPLDKLYTYLLTTAIRDINSTGFDALQLVFLATEIGVDCRLSSRITKLLSVDHDQINPDLGELHSLIAVTPQQIRFHEGSFSEFLTDPSRSGKFYAGGPLTLPLQTGLLDLVQTQFVSGDIDAISMLVPIFDHGFTDSLGHLRGTMKQRDGVAIRVLHWLLQTILMANIYGILADPTQSMWLMTKRNVQLFKLYMQLQTTFYVELWTNSKGDEDYAKWIQKWGSWSTILTLQTWRIILFINILTLALQTSIGFVAFCLRLITFSTLDIRPIFGPLISLLATCSAVAWKAHLLWLAFFFIPFLHVLEVRTGLLTRTYSTLVANLRISYSTLMRILAYLSKNLAE